MATLPRALYAQRAGPCRAWARMGAYGTAFVQDDAEAAQQWRPVADQLRPKVPKLAAHHGRG